MIISNAIVQIYIHTGSANEPGFFEDFKVLPRPISKNAALKELAFTRSCNGQEHFRLKLEDWNSGATEIIE